MTIETLVALTAARQAEQHAKLHATVEPIACEACGYQTDDLTEVPDLDPAVGYAATLLVCQGCIAGTVFHVEHPTEQCGPLWTGVLSAAEVSEIAPF